MIRHLVVLMLIFLLASCQVVKIGEPKGLGALAIIVDIDAPGGRYMCRKITLYMKPDDNGKSGAVESLEVFASNNNSYALFSNIPPNKYNINKVRCYAKKGYILNDSYSYLEYQADLSVSVLPNTLEVPAFKVVGWQENDYFEYGTEFIDSSQREEWLDKIKKENDTTGWDLTF